MNDNQVKKLIDKDKIHKLIHKLFLGDSLTDNQYKVVYDYVKEKGVTINRTGLTCRPVFDKDIECVRQNWEKVIVPGWYYSGIFVDDSGELMWYYLQATGVWTKGTYKLENLK
jgi:hypothetical protein